MSISSTLERLHAKAKQNLWLWLFSIFCRVALALGFIPSGIVKILDERFASGLHANHPMGHYLEALHTTGFYYTFIGVIQIAAALLLLIPRTVTLGAFLYFPIILNITVLTFATRFDGSLFTSPLMTLANLYVLAWNYEKWKFILPFNRLENAGDFSVETNPEQFAGENRKNPKKRSGILHGRAGAAFGKFQGFLKKLSSERFPILFFGGVFAVTFFFVAIFPGLFDVRPRNTLAQCVRQFDQTERTRAGAGFCDCIHTDGEPLGKCLEGYEKSPDD